VLSTQAISRTEDVVSSGGGVRSALTEGYQTAFAAGAGFAVAGVVVGLLVVKGRPAEADAAAAEAASG
jgi:hypothetical protein